MTRPVRRTQDRSGRSISTARRDSCSGRERGTPLIVSGSVAEYECGGGRWWREFGPVSIDDRARSAIERLWPLAVGKKVKFTMSMAAGTARATLTVDRTEDIRIAGANRSTYVVVEYVVLPIYFGFGYALLCEPEFRRTIWYDPTQGIIVRDQLRWLTGEYPGTGWEYELVEARFPKR